MTRRLFIGQVGGAIDMRISRPGFDALTADVSNRTQISFALSRDVMGRVASAGSISGLDGFVPFAETFSSPPPVLFGVLRDGGMMIDEYNRQTGNDGRYADGTPYAAVVTTTSIAVTNPMSFAYGLPAGDRFVYMAIQ